MDFEKIIPSLSFASYIAMYSNPLLVAKSYSQEQLNADKEILLQIFQKDSREYLQILQMIDKAEQTMQSIRNIETQITSDAETQNKL